MSFVISFFITFVQKLFKFNFFVKNLFSRHYIKNKSFNYIQNFKHANISSILANFHFVTNECAYYCEIENDYCTASYCVAGRIDYHRYRCFDIDSLRFSFTSSLFRPFRDLKRIERPVDRSPLFLFFFLPLLYSFPPSHSTFPICIEMKTYLFGGLRPKSLLSLVEQGMDVPCPREFVHVANTLVFTVHLCSLSGSSYFFPSRGRNQQ